MFPEQKPWDKALCTLCPEVGGQGDSGCYKRRDLLAGSASLCLCLRRSGSCPQNKIFSENTIFCKNPPQTSLPICTTQSKDFREGNGAWLHPDAFTLKDPSPGTIRCCSTTLPEWAGMVFSDGCWHLPLLHPSVRAKGIHQAEPFLGSHRARGGCGTSSLLAATVSLVIGSGFGERAVVAAYTLALCFCTSLQGMWERKKSWADMLWGWMQCRRTGQAARPPPVMSSPPQAGLRSCCDMEEPPPWPAAHCCVGAVSQGAVRGSLGMWSCYGGGLRVKAFLVRGGGCSRWKCPTERHWWALPSVLVVKVPAVKPGTGAL